jgi:uncharacterized phage protein (TIGR01671 family)
MTQRTILFRGKSIESGEWVEGDLVQSNNQYNHKTLIWPINTSTTDNMVGVDPATVGQLTGLTDKNGVNIFEGDCFGNDNIPIRHVVFEDGKFCFNRTHSQGADVLSQDRIGRLEIIGNIHTK